MRLPTIFCTVLLTCACAPVMDAASTGPIKQNPTERTFGSAIDDESIENITSVNINKASNELRSAHINVVSYNGVVLLVGQAPSDSARSRAANIAANVQRVRQVQNAITVEPNVSLAVRSYDTLLTTKIKSKFALDNEVKGKNIKIITENGVVYLMGLVSQQQADRAASLAQKTDGAQRIVKAFEYID